MVLPNAHPAGPTSRDVPWRTGDLGSTAAMIISNSRRFIFVHVMKCAGTAIDASLAPHLGWNDIRFGADADGEALSRIYWDRHGLHKHASAAMVRGVVGPAVWDTYRTMATVRCPYDRVASAWRFTAASVEPILAAAGFPENASAAVRVAWLDGPECPAGWQWRWPPGRAYLRLRGRPDAFSAFLRCPEVISQDVLLHSQHSLLSDPADGHVLVRQVIRVEDLERDWPGFVASIGLPGLALLRLNTTADSVDGGMARLFAQAADVALVNELHAEDFARFGYPMRQPTG